jgi:pimeloyl-ACP methyl ester carboxylesterase
MRDGEISVNGRTVAFADYGTPDQIAVLWCHGGPGSRLEPQVAAAQAASAGLRLVGIDRPGYGRSTPQPGRTIGGWVPEALAVADYLGIDRFVTVGCSTGGAYALALASMSDRVIGTVACCALTDMRWAEGKAKMPAPLRVWTAPDRAAAMAIVASDFGEDGSRMMVQPGGADLCAADVALLADPAFGPMWASWIPSMFAYGVAGYTDDCLADGGGWSTFDVTAIRCPVVVLHGSSDTIVPLFNAHHTATIVPGASLHVVDGLGHLSIITQVVNVIPQVLHRAGVRLLGVSI